MGNSIQKQAFFPPTPPREIPEKYRTNRYSVTTSEGHQIPLLYFPSSQSNYTLVFSHGNAEDLGGIAQYLKYLSKQLKISVVGYDYLGYGHCELMPSSFSYPTSSLFSSNRQKVCQYPSEKGTYQSIDAVYKYLTTQLNLPAETLIFMGQSIGSGPTTNLCSRKICGGMILVSPFKSAVKVVTETSLAAPIDFFKNASIIEKVKAPIFIIHGTHDNVIPCSHGKELYQILQQSGHPNLYPPLWVEGADHNDLVEFPEYHREIQYFINSITQN